VNHCVSLIWFYESLKMFLDTGALELRYFINFALIPVVTITLEPLDFNFILWSPLFMLVCLIISFIKLETFSLLFIIKVISCIAQLMFVQAILCRMTREIWVIIDSNQKSFQNIMDLVS